jgi:galactoside O-acetyltransferase
MQNHKELHSGKMYLPTDEELMREQAAYQETLYDYNLTRPGEVDRRQLLLREMFAEIGEDCYIEPPLHANWGGHHVHFGKKIYANYNLTLVDDTHIYVGDYTMFGPNVTIATAAHPLDAAKRREGYQYNLPVRIGRNCWLGAGVVVLPGVTIGDHVVVGAGSIVTKDLPSNVVAVGNPCRVIRHLDEGETDSPSETSPY